MEKKSFDPLGGASHERVYHRNDASIYTGRKLGSIGSQIAASEPVRTDSPTSPHRPKDGEIPADRQTLRWLHHLVGWSAWPG